MPDEYKSSRSRPQSLRKQIRARQSPWLRDTHIINTTGVHVFLLIADLKDNFRHGPQHRQDCGISDGSLCEVRAAEPIVDEAQKRDAEIIANAVLLTLLSRAGRLKHDAGVVDGASVS